MDKKQIATNILSRANSALLFLNHALSFRKMKADDVAWQRSILMIISYAFELIVKAEIVFTTQNTEVDVIDKELKDLGHKIQLIMCELEKRGSLSLMDIVDYKIDNSNGLVNYIIFFKDEKKIITEDFIDIRYDYVKDTLRTILNHDDIVGYIDKCLELSKNVSTRERSI